MCSSINVCFVVIAYTSPMTKKPFILALDSRDRLLKFVRPSGRRVSVLETRQLTEIGHDGVITGIARDVNGRVTSVRSASFNATYTYEGWCQHL